MKKLALLSTLLWSGLAIAEVPPNMIVFLADDMGMGDTSAYQDWCGNSGKAQLHTPAMDKLAANGVRFTDAHSPSSRCTPTRYALLTGRYCWRTHLKHWVLFGNHGDPLIERDRLTLPEFLQKSGYTTGILGKWHLGLSYSAKNGKPAKGWEDADLTKPLLDGPLDHGFAWNGTLNPKELYNLADDREEARNVIDHPEYEAVVTFLLEQAKSAAGDNGSTRNPLPAGSAQFIYSATE